MEDQRRSGRSPALLGVGGIGKEVCGDTVSSLRMRGGLRGEQSFGKAGWELTAPGST